MRDLKIRDQQRGKPRLCDSWNVIVENCIIAEMDFIIEALVEAGYFRARISTLSDFDKVIGGMAWAMQVFSQDIDINIFYRDTLDLGQKIALTERLVMVLLVTKCPHKVEPHQIVGLDHANLLPVIKWLIKRSSEIRREHEAFNRLLALRHYHRVTNTMANRDQWCHVLRIDQLKALSSGSDKSELDKISPQIMSTADSNFIKRLKTDFKDNQLISFVESQPAFVSEVDKNRTTQIDRNEINAEDEYSDDSGGESELNAYDAKPENSIPEPPQDIITVIGTEQVKEIDSCPVSDELEKSPEINAVHNELDTELLATNQKILTLLKKLDSMPSDLEIVQYQKRYIELHQELISKNKDLKKIYALFNSLDSVKHYLTKEMNLLDSIMVNLDLTTNNPGNRFEFLRQFQEIILKIQAVRGEVNDRLALMRTRCDLLNEEYSSLKNQQD